MSSDLLPKGWFKLNFDSSIQSIMVSQDLLKVTSAIVGVGSVLIDSKSETTSTIRGLRKAMLWISNFASEGSL